MWLPSNSHDKKPVKVRVVNGIPVAEVVENLSGEGNRLLMLTDDERVYYLQQLALQGYQLSCENFNKQHSCEERKIPNEL